MAETLIWIYYFFLASGDFFFLFQVNFTFILIELINEAVIYFSVANHSKTFKRDFLQVQSIYFLYFSCDSEVIC